MRVTVTGSHSTGKSSLIEETARRLRQAGRDVHVSEEVARQLIRRGVPLNADVTRDSWIEYAKAQIESDRIARLHEMAICDRSLLDLLIYIVASKNSVVSSLDRGLIRELILFESTLFDHYIYVPVEFAMITDDVRPADVEFQKSVDATTVELLEQLSLPWQTVRGDFESRVLKMENILQSNR